MNRLTSPPINTITIHSGDERWIFRYTQANTHRLLQTLGRMACDPASAFTWYLAAQVSQRIRQLAEVE